MKEGKKLTNQQVDILLDEIENNNYYKLMEFIDDEKLRLNILSAGEYYHFRIKIFQNIMKQLEKEGYDYFYSKLSSYPKVKEFLIGLSDLDKIKTCLEDSELELSSSIKCELLVNLNDINYFEKYIKTEDLNYFDIVNIISIIGDKDYIKKCCEGKGIKLDNSDIIWLLKKIDEPEYIKEYIKDNKLLDNDFIELVIATKDSEYMKSLVFKCNKKIRVKLVKAIDDIEFTKQCIEDVNFYAQEKLYLINYLMEDYNEDDYAKKCIYNKSLHLKSRQIREMLINLLQKGENKEFVKELLKDKNVVMDNKDKIILIMEIGGENYLRECYTNNELGLDFGDRSRLLLRIEDKKFLKNELLNNKIISSFCKRDILERKFCSNREDKNFVKKCIESKAFGLSPLDKIALMKKLDDKKYIKTCIENNELDLTVSDKVRLVIFLGAEYIEECLRNKILNFSSSDVVSLLDQVGDADFKKSILEDKRYNISFSDKIKIIAGTSLMNEYLTTMPYLTFFMEEPDEHLLEATLKNNKEVNLSKDMTIGIEIESEGDLARYIKTDFKYNEWETKEDQSLANGVEVVSPILHSNDKDSKQIHLVSSILKAMGQNATEFCGGHVHIGADFLKSVEAWSNFTEIYCNVEKILYAITNEVNTAPRDGVMHFATPMTPNIKEALERGTINFDTEEDLDKFVKDLRRIQLEQKNDEEIHDELSTKSYNRYFGVNFSNLGTHVNTIEFRMANGTLDSDLWIDNINLFGGIVAVSHELSELQNIKKLTIEQQRKIKIFEKLKTDISDREKLEILIELIDLEPEGYIKRFEANMDLLMEEKELFDTLSQDKPIRIKKDSTITLDEIEESIVDVLAFEEIEAMNQMVNSVQERGRGNIQK